MDGFILFEIDDADGIIAQLRNEKALTSGIVSHVIETAAHRTE
jgi:hypothetical protein